MLTRCLPPHANAQRSFVPLSSRTCEMVRWGSGQPLVLLPGLAGGTDLMSPLGQALGEHFDVLSYNHRGEEDLFGLRQRYGVDEVLRDLDEVLEHLCLERPVLMGVSFGGVLALEYAARWPHRLSGLVIQGAEVRFRPSLLRRIAGQVLVSYPLPSDSAFVNQFFNLLFGGVPRDRRVFDFVISRCWQTDQTVIAHRFRMAEEVDLTGRLGRIQVPTLVLTGEHDLLVSDDGLQEMVRQIPQAESVKIPGAGHLAFVTHVPEVVRHVSRFATELDLLGDSQHERLT